MGSSGEEHLRKGMGSVKGVMQGQTFGWTEEESIGNTL